ncbi:FtsB family cell division protein [Nocardioides panaciterrulae]|uniref:Cell division protein FtsB n=1 Tax=Nocardioides panaciterrulae TaxID=661492 RepID=A0A7Y9E8G7_9ACTN|nr:septum formation initiator family protein [Nocardioides panaciterrulae]NYD43053.1 cell division protein FtsB [Nocardioides panaciterrulae]
MADNRRTPRRGAAAKGSSPRGRSGPGRTSSAARPRPAVPSGAAGDGPEGSRGGRGPRFTSRAVILLVVVAVLAVSYASSMRAYLQQRSHITDLKAQIAQRQADIDQLEREKRRWHDPAFVQAQARQRFGYLMPGEKSYVVLGEDGQPLQSESLTDPATVAQRAPTAWWTAEWRSVELAGNPPKPQAPPAAEIGAGKKSQ